MPTFIKKITSYITPKVIYETSSAYNKDIKVIDVGKNRKLLVNGFVQSYKYPAKIAERRVWKKIAKLIREQKPNIKSILLLGMGAGTMLHYLDENNPNSNIYKTSVEIDKSIIEIAKKYFSLNEIKHNKVIAANAYNVISNPKRYGIQNTFDCVIVDTYLGDKHTGIVNTSFSVNLDKVTHKDSFVVFNVVILRTERQKIDIYKKNLAKLISKPKCIRVNCHNISDNYLFYGKPLQKAMNEGN